MLRWLFTQGEAEASVHHARKLVTTTGLDFQTVGQDHLWCAPALGASFGILISLTFLHLCVPVCGRRSGPLPQPGTPGCHHYVANASGRR